MWMFKITCFAPIEPKQLEKALNGIHFRTVKNGFEWSMDGITFRIVPFQNEPRGPIKGYRVYFDGDIHGGSYLFDLSLGCLGAEVTGVEYILTYPKMDTVDWINDIRKRSTFQMVDARGLFLKHGVGVIVVNNSVTLQLHSRKNKKLIMVDAIKKIDFIREELVPVKIRSFFIVPGGNRMIVEFFTGKENQFVVLQDKIFRNGEVIADGQSVLIQHLILNEPSWILIDKGEENPPLYFKTDKVTAVLPNNEFFNGKRFSERV